MFHIFYTALILLLALAPHSAIYSMDPTANLPQFEGFEREVLDSTTDEESDTSYEGESDSEDRPFNLLGHIVQPALSASTAAATDTRDSVHPNDSEIDALPAAVQQQQQQAAASIPIVTHAILMRQGTLTDVDSCIRNFMYHNEAIRSELEAGLVSIEETMRDPEFLAEIQIDAKKIAHEPKFAAFDEDTQAEIINHEVEFKLAQYKAFSFAQLFQEKVALAEHPLRRYKRQLKGTPPSSPVKQGQHGRKRVHFDTETDVAEIPSVARDYKRPRN